MFSFARKVWGSGQSKRFKLASWGVAFAMFGVWYYVDKFLKDEGKIITQKMVEKPKP